MFERNNQHVSLQFWTDGHRRCDIEMSLWGRGSIKRVTQHYTDAVTIALSHQVNNALHNYKGPRKPITAARNINIRLICQLLND